MVKKGQSIILSLSDAQESQQVHQDEQLNQQQVTGIGDMFLSKIKFYGGTLNIYILKLPIHQVSSSKATLVVVDEALEG